MNKSEYERLSQFRHSLRCFLRASEDLCQSHGLTALQYQLLLHIKGFPQREWATVSELAERLQAKHHGVVALIDRCEKAGLVERRADERDRRRVTIHLLATGNHLVETLARLHSPEVQHLREVLDRTGGDSSPDETPVATARLRRVTAAR